MKRALEDLAEKRITFSQFWRRTIKDWRALSANLLRQFPVWYIEVDDLVQIMAFEAWSRISTYDPKRGRTLSDYVVFNACDKAKKTLIKARVDKRGVKATLVMPDTTIAALGYDEFRSEKTRVESIIERQDAAHVLYRVRNRLSYKSACALAAFQIADGTFEDAGRTLFADDEMRSCLELDSVESATKIVRTALAEARRRITTIESEDL